MLDNLKNLASLVSQARQMSGRLQDMGQQLRDRRVTGQAGGGLVEVEMNGLLEVVACRVAPEIFSQGDREMLEDLLVSACNQAAQKSRNLHTEAMQSLGTGINLPPGMEDMLGKWLGGQGT